MLTAIACQFVTVTQRMSKVFFPLVHRKSVTTVNGYKLYELNENKTTSDMKTAALKQMTLQKQELTYLLRTISTQGFT